MGRSVIVSGWIATDYERQQAMMCDMDGRQSFAIGYVLHTLINMLGGMEKLSLPVALQIEQRQNKQVRLVTYL
jgi:hypothetical protein